MADAPRLAEIVGGQPAWRLDLVVLGDEVAAGSDPAAASEASYPADRAERLIGSEFADMAVVAAWAAFESAARVHLRQLGRYVDRDTLSGAIPSELYSAGLLSPAESSAARDAYSIRRHVVHGMPTRNIETTPEYAKLVRSLTAVAQRLRGVSSLVPQLA